MSSFEEISNMFDTESKKLETLFESTTKPDLSIHEIIETYYQILNVSSMCTMLKQTADVNNQKYLLERISDTENLISDKFNSQIHPHIMENLSKSIQEITSNLQAQSSGQKPKEEIENEAKLYEELRQKMSTKEFVEQYDKGLK